MSSHPIFTSRFEIVDESRIVIVSMTGDLDPRAVEDLHPQLQELIRAGYRQFVLDLSALDHLGSLALRLFIALAKQVKDGGGVVLCDPSERIAFLISLTNVDRILKVYPTRDLAIAALHNPGFRKPPVGLAKIWPLTSRVASGRRRRPRRS
jgi:anti-sigma B factor antagonist